MEIKAKSTPDPMTDVPISDAYMLWALLAAEEVVGKQGLAVVLRDAGLGRFIDYYPSNDMKATCNLTCGDYTNLFTSLYSFYGRAGKSILIRIGRLSARHSINEQGALFNLAAITALRLMPASIQIKVGLENMQSGLRKIWHNLDEEVSLGIEDRGDKVAYVAETCVMCAGKQADGMICVAFVGALQEAALWLTGKEYDVREVECRALGARACVWEISKLPKE